MALNKREIERLLKSEIVYLATCDTKGNPHVKPIWFIFDQGKIWFETDIITRAFKNIKENNKIMLCFGGRETYLVWGKVKWYKEKDAPVEFRKMFWKKYGKFIDDPRHMVKNGRSLDQISVDKFIGKGVLIKISDKKFDLDAIKSTNIEQGDIVLFYTGISEVYHQSEYYDNYPAITKEIAEYLVNKKVKMVGVDMC